MTQITKEWSIFHTKWRPLSASVEDPTMEATAAARYLHGGLVSFVSPLNRQDQIKLNSKNIFPRRVQWPTTVQLYTFYDEQPGSIPECMRDTNHSAISDDIPLTLQNCTVPANRIISCTLYVYSRYTAILHSHFCHWCVTNAVGVWTGSSWLRIETGDGHLWMR